MRTSFILVAILATVSQTALAEDIPFDKVFTERMQHPIRDTILIDIDDSSVLLFPASPTTFYLEGRNLVISAKTIRLDANVLISSFSGPAPAFTKAANDGVDQGPKGQQQNCGSNPGDNGDNGGSGQDGSAGSPGARGGVVFLQVSQVEGVGKLSIENSGQTGGRGQTSGRGGTGGGGGQGCNRECGPLIGSGGHGSGPGGTGGTGGRSGLPGVGGSGGDGGEVRYSAAIANQLGQKIAIEVLGGGIGGIGYFGKRGLKGNKGAGGAPATCDGQGMIGGGHDGDDGKDGECGALLGTPGELPLLPSCPAPIPIPNSAKDGVSEPSAN